MNEWSTNQTQQVPGCASVAAMRGNVSQRTVCDPIRTRMQITYTPGDTRSDAVSSLMAGTHGLGNSTTRRRTDPALQHACGRSACAEQSVMHETVDAWTQEPVTPWRHARDESSRQQRHRLHQDSHARCPMLDVARSGLPCGPTAACATTGSVAGHEHRRGRQGGRVLAPHSEDVGGDRLVAGTVPMITAWQPVVEAAETTMHLGEATHAWTRIRVDAGSER